MLKGIFAKLFAPKKVWAVYNPTKRAVWCSKVDCPNLNRKITYDITKDDDLEEIVMTGVSQDMADEEGVIRKTKRVSTPTIKHHDLGVIAAFPTEKEAVDFIKGHFKSNQNTIDKETEYELLISEIVLT